MQKAFHEYRKQLLHFIRKHTSNAADAEDILQDVFLKMLQNQDSIKERGRLLSWLYQATRHAIIDYYRTHKKFDSIVEELPTPPKDSLFPLDIGKCIQPFIAELPGHYRIPLVLSEIDGLSQGEVAQRLGLSIPGAKSRIQRGKRILKGNILECCHIDQGPRGITGYRIKNVQKSKCFQS